MRFQPVIFCLLLLVGCAAPSAAQQASLSQSHLDREENLLTDALHYFAGSNIAGTEAAAGFRSLTAAHDFLPVIRQDVNNLANTAVSLQQQIDAHRNDLLGPRARRIRNRVILIGVLLAIGSALLHLGPLVGGPFGGGLIVAGHLLTAFLVPLWNAAFALFRKAVTVIFAGIEKLVGYLDKLAKNPISQEGSVTPNAPSPTD